MSVQAVSKNGRREVCIFSRFDDIEGKVCLQGEVIIVGAQNIEAELREDGQLEQYSTPLTRWLRIINLWLRGSSWAFRRQRGLRLVLVGARSLGMVLFARVYNKGVALRVGRD